MTLILYRSCWPDKLLLPSGFWTTEPAYILDLFPPRAFRTRKIYQAELDPNASLVHSEQPACNPVLEALRQVGIQVVSFEAWDWPCLEYVVFDPSCLRNVQLSPYGR